MKAPYIGAVVNWVYASQHLGPRVCGKTTAAIVTRVIDAERGKVELQAFKLDCHGCIRVDESCYSDDGEPGTWRWPGE